MKASLAVLVGFLSAIGAFAQGTVNFANSSTTRIATNTTALPPPGQLPNQTGFLTGPGEYTIALYIAPQGTTDPQQFTLMGPTTTANPSGLSPFNGFFNGNTPEGSFIISNNTGQTIAFQVRAWSTFFGPTHQDALDWRGASGWLGQSAIGEVTPAMGGAPANLFGSGPGQVGAFTLTPWPVPEPSSTALLLLGAAGLGLWRFRSRRH